MGEEVKRRGWWRRRMEKRRGWWRWICGGKDGEGSRTGGGGEGGGPFPIVLTELRRDHCTFPAHSAALIRSILSPGTPGLQVG